MTLREVRRNENASVSGELENVNKNAEAIRKQATGAQAIGALAVGAMALGATAIGALAIGRLVVGRLVVRKSHVRSLEIEELNVKRVRVGRLIVTDELVMPDGEAAVMNHLDTQKSQREINLSWGAPRHEMVE
jgi:hypothetical protein